MKTKDLILAIILVGGLSVYSFAGYFYKTNIHTGKMDIAGSTEVLNNISSLDSTFKSYTSTDRTTSTEFKAYTGVHKAVLGADADFADIHATSIHLPTGDITVTSGTIWGQTVQGNSSLVTSNTGALKAAYIQDYDGYPSIPTPDLVNHPGYTTSAHGGIVSRSKMTNESTARRAHEVTTTPYGGHPAAGNPREVQYNNAGTASGAAQLRYTSGTTILQTTDRYGHSQEWRGPNNELQAYMLGSGCMVFGQPYTDAFTISGWTEFGTDWTNSDFINNFPRWIKASITHSLDDSTVTASNIVFRGFTSWVRTPSTLLFSTHSVIPQHTKVRVVILSTIRDLDGKYLYQNYSSPFYNYSGAGI